jgi:hypothetical protein
MLDTLKGPDRGHARHGARGAASQARKPYPLNNTNKINVAALRALPFLLARWLPGGKRIGKEYIALNPTRADRHYGSFKVMIVGHRADVWATLATVDRAFSPGLVILARPSAALRRARRKWPRRSSRLRVCRAAA